MENIYEIYVTQQSHQFSVEVEENVNVITLLNKGCGQSAPDPDIPPVTNVHNETTGKQGGNELLNEFYHLSLNDFTKVKSLINTDGIATISVSPSSGEKGVSTSLTVSYAIESNDDTYTSATINQGIGNVFANIDSGTNTASGGSTVVDKSFTLTAGYTRNGIPATENKTANYAAYIPQFAGVSAEEDYATYSALNSDLSKYIQSSASINKLSTPSSEYIWFVSSKNGAIVKDQNDFLQTQGAWGNADKEFWTKSITLTLADGVTTATVYLFRSRLTKTIPTGFTYKIS